MTDLGAQKAALRAELRGVRRSLTDRPERSARIWDRVRAMSAVDRARNLLVFDSVPGEPETASFIAWCRDVGKQVSAPEDDVDPAWPDVVIVPGVAFTPSGERVGQGGGWYDRFLAEIRSECVTIGVCFAPQLRTSLPIEPHDIVLDHVVTD